MSDTARPGDNDLLARTCDNGVLTLTLNAPPANALSSAMIARLQAALDDAAADRRVRVIVLAATGRIFSAGHDLREMRAHMDDPATARARLDDLFARCAAMMTSVARSPRPVIARVDGLATAAGCQLVAACDLAYASERATFCTPGVNMGGFCSTPMVALSRAVGRKAAMEMLLSGDRIDAAAARAIGLVNRVVPVADLDAFVADFARRLAARPPDAIASGRRAFHDQADLPLDAAYALASRVMVEQFFDPATAEGIDAFLERRAPVWNAD